MYPINPPPMPTPPVTPPLTSFQQQQGGQPAFQFGDGSGFSGSGLFVPTNSPVNSSTNFRQGVDNLGNQITDTVNKPPQVPSLFDTTALTEGKEDGQKLITDRRKQLEDRRKTEIDRITAEFDSAQSTLSSAQKNEKGSSSMGLARIGGFDSASGQSMLIKLEADHKSEQQALLTKRQTAIQMANNAHEDKDFALAELQLKEAREMDKAIYEREKAFVDYTIDLKNQFRQDAQFDFNKKKEENDIMRLARDFAVENGIQDPFYVIGGAIYESQTGLPIAYDEFIDKGGDPTFANAKIIEPGEQDAKDFVRKLAEQYPDAISIDMTPEQAQQALGGSAIYKDKIRPPAQTTERNRASKITMLNLAKNELAKPEYYGTDTYLDPGVYLDLRTDYGAMTGETGSFDNLFAAKLSPQERARLLDKATGFNALEQGDGIDQLIEGYIAKQANKPG